MPLTGYRFQAPLPLVGPLGQLHVDRNPVQYGGTATAYWNINGISAIWFDKGAGTGFMPAAGSQSTSVNNVTAARMLQLKWQTTVGEVFTDALTVEVMPVQVRTVSVETTRPPKPPAR